MNVLTRKISSINGFMGRQVNETDRKTDLFPGKIFSSDNKEVLVRISGEDAYSAPEILAMILQKLKADAETCLGQTITEAVIAVPDYFNDVQRQATKDAGKIAGLDIKRIVSEPAAEALTWGRNTGKEHLIAVYDLGGGVFYISLKEKSREEIKPATEAASVFQKREDSGRFHEIAV